MAAKKLQTTKPPATAPLPLPAKPEALSRAVRTGEGLRDVLFDEIDGLRDGTRDPKHALAVAKISTQIINTVYVEINYQRHLQKSAVPGVLPGGVPTIRLGHAG